MVAIGSPFCCKLVAVLWLNDLQLAQYEFRLQPQGNQKKENYATKGNENATKPTKMQPNRQPKATKMQAVATKMQPVATEMQPIDNQNATSDNENATSGNEDATNWQPKCNQWQPKCN